MEVAESSPGPTVRNCVHAVGATVSSDDLFPSYACRADRLRPGDSVFLPLVTPRKTFPVAGWEDGMLTVRVGDGLWEVPLDAGAVVAVYDWGDER